jgi:hypothetical protein
MALREYNKRGLSAAAGQTATSLELRSLLRLSGGMAEVNADVSRELEPA